MFRKIMLIAVITAVPFLMVAQNGNSNSNAGGNGNGATNKLTPTGKIGIGTMSPNSEFEVIGKTDLKGEMEVSGKVNMKDSLKVEKALDVYGKGRFNNGIEVSYEARFKQDAVVEGYMKLKALEDMTLNYDRYMFVDPSGAMKINNTVKSTSTHALDITGDFVTTGKSEFKNEVILDYLEDLDLVQGEVRPLYIGANGIVEAGHNTPRPEHLCGGAASSALPIMPFNSVPGSDNVFLCGFNLGIGLALPQYPLDVAGNAHISGELKIGRNSLYLGTNTTGTAGAFNYIYTDDAALKINSDEGQVGGVQNTLINPDGGQVGIGTTMPNASLQIDRNQDGAALSINHIVSAEYSRAFLINVNKEETAAICVSRNGQDVFKVRGNGVVNVSKTLYAKTVKVRADPTSFLWPDYVFEKKYDLMSVHEVEQYIKENKHLPGVPSEKEVLENGIDLGAMDAAILKKVEELYLYVIELKKENDFLKSEVELLKQR
ncbi:MAG: hypothetical protein JKY53_06795 [Flavobacteriales bacterium]|nr:hypothetical protein [Flavobacteriales bacterium]